MAEMFTMRGLDKVLAQMKAVKDDVKGKSARTAMAKAARIVTNAAKANARRVDDSTTGRQISQNISQRFASKTYRATGDIMYRIGVATPKGKIPKGNPDEGAKGPTYHWHLIELGTGTVPAKPFMLPALSSNINQATDKFVTELSLSLDKAASA